MKNLIFPALLLLASPSHALISTYEFSGKTTYPAWKMALDDMIHGTLEIDEQGPEEFDFRSESSRSYYAAKITLKAGGVTFSTDRGGINGHARWEWTVNPGHQGTDNHLLENDANAYASFGISFPMYSNSLTLLAANDMDQRWAGGEWGMEISDPNDPAPEGWYALESLGGEITSLRKIVMRDAEPVPEPASAAMLGAALAGFLAYRRRKTTS